MPQEEEDKAHLSLLGEVEVDMEEVEVEEMAEAQEEEDNHHTLQVEVLVEEQGEDKAHQILREEEEVAEEVEATAHLKVLILGSKVHADILDLEALKVQKVQQDLQVMEDQDEVISKMSPIWI